MRIRVTLPSADEQRLREKLLASAEQVEKDDVKSEDWEIVNAHFLFAKIGC
jgi:ribosome maturation protein SDO1